VRADQGSAIGGELVGNPAASRHRKQSNKETVSMNTQTSRQGARKARV
jgi:hypothetical protein